MPCATRSFDLVLTGLQSDDQGFGQVGVILAEKLGMPHATIIMEVQASESGAARQARARGGLVPVDRAAAAGAADDSERHQSASLCDAQGNHGGEEEGDSKVTPAAWRNGSQKILSMYVPEKGKKTQLISGSPAEAARELRDPPARRGEGHPVTTLVVAEQREGKLNRASWEAIAGAQQAGGPVSVAVLGSGVDAVARSLPPLTSPESSLVDDPALAHYTADGYVQALQQLVAAEQPSHVFFPHTYQTRDFAPALAARLDRPLIADVIAIKTQGSDLVYVRPVFQGKLSADVVATGPAPHLATFQIGAYRADAARRGRRPPPIRKGAVTIDAATIRQKPEAPFKEARQAVDLSQAERIVAAGRGIKAQEHLKLVEQLAQALGAEVAASRPICDAGWLPMDRQIGSSGQTVAPKLYLALGISGAIQHLVGMKGSRTIVAINKDADAPIFEIADYGIVGDLFEVVPALIAELNK